MEQAPELVRTESLWDDFLWTENYDIDRAALRLARYWKGRKFAFQQDDRWLKPLNQTGHGALTRADIEVLRTGYMVPLVRPHGKGMVVLIDRSKLTRPPGMAVIRMSFYFAAIFAKDMRPGFTYIAIQSADPNLQFHQEENTNQEAWTIFNVCLPFKAHRKRLFVVKSCFQPGREALAEYLSHAHTLKLKYRSQTARIGRISGNSVAATVRQLVRDSHVERSCLPQCIGGHYDYRSFEDWITERVSIEMAQIPIHTRVLSSSSSSMDHFHCCNNGWNPPPSLNPTVDCHHQEKRAQCKHAGVGEMKNHHYGNKRLLMATCTTDKSERNEASWCQPLSSKPHVGANLHWVDYRKGVPL